MRKQPLLVHLVFHPDATKARQLALKIHQALNDDPVMPGLRIPTVFCAEEGDNLPPPNQNLEQAECSFVVIFADDEINDDNDWCSYVANLWEDCQGSQHRCLPIQLSEDAWPLDQRLSGVNFVRAFDGLEDKQYHLVIGRLITELCRYLHGDQMGGASPNAPTKVFVSHTKLDVDKDPKVVQHIQHYLHSAQPIKTWFDSGDIPGGSSFAKEISAGVKDSSLLCVLTDNYAGREWCRKEILLAKQLQRPIVLIDALSEREVRSFPYIGNLPVLRWNNNPEAAINLLLKETLRHLHNYAILKQWCEPNDIILSTAPELLTLLKYPLDAKILYPDPPLGAEETNTLARLDVDITTPLERVAKEKLLIGRLVALSMSESTDIQRFGFSDKHFEIVMLEITRYLLLKGVTLAYGGHLGSNGYTLRLAELVRANNQLEGVKPIERIENYLGWPLPFDKKIKGKYKFLANIKRIGRPTDVTEDLHPDFIKEPNFFPAEKSPVHRYAWARGMTEMRIAETADASARIVLGGTFGPTIKAQPDGSRQEKWYASRIPGVLEEVMLSIDAQQPIFLIGAFGGVALLIIDILEGRHRDEMSWDYQKRAPYADDMRNLYSQYNQLWLDYPKMIDVLREKGIKGINPTLSEDEHKELFHTRDSMRMVEIIVNGLSGI